MRELALTKREGREAFPFLFRLLNGYCFSLRNWHNNHLKLWA